MKGTDWKKKFEEYHKNNPHIYDEFEKLALHAATRRTNFSVHNIFGKMRWDSAIRGDDGFKINENYCPYYGRMFEEKNPQHKGFFRKKKILPSEFTIDDYNS
jgi:hypothetical protein